MLPLLGRAVLIALNPAGPVHNVFTVTGTSTAELNSTVQIKVRTSLYRSDKSWLAGSLVTLTEIGSGT